MPSGRTPLRHAILNCRNSSTTFCWRIASGCSPSCAAFALETNRGPRPPSTHSFSGTPVLSRRKPRGSTPPARPIEQTLKARSFRTANARLLKPSCRSVSLARAPGAGCDTAQRLGGTPPATDFILWLTTRPGTSGPIFSRRSRPRGAGWTLMRACAIRPLLPLQRLKATRCRVKRRVGLGGKGWQMAGTLVKRRSYAYNAGKSRLVARAEAAPPAPVRPTRPPCPSSPNVSLDSCLRKSGSLRASWAIWRRSRNASGPPRRRATTLWYWRTAVPLALRLGWRRLTRPLATPAQERTHD